MTCSSENGALGSPNGKEDTEPLEVFCDQPPKDLSVKTAHGDTAVHVYNSEATETVVIAHGLGGNKEQFQEGHMAQRLATRYRVITFDWYGHGNSPCCPGDYKKEEFLEQLYCVIDELVPGSFHLYGFSMGCFLSLQYVANFPQRVSRLVLHSPWNAEMSIFGPGSETAVRIPLLGLAALAIVRHFSFPYCHDAKTFKRILLTLGEGKEAWRNLLDRISNVRENLEILLICGTGETPFHRVAQEINEKFKGSSQLYSYPKSQHTSWCAEWDQPVGRFFRNHIYDFLIKID